MFDAQLQGSHNGGNASSAKKNDSQNKKTKPIHHLMQSVIVLQPEHRAGIDYKRDDTSLWTVCYIIINKYPFILESGLLQRIDYTSGTQQISHRVRRPFLASK